MIGQYSLGNLDIDFTVILFHRLGQPYLACSVGMTYVCISCVGALQVPDPWIDGGVEAYEISIPSPCDVRVIESNFKAHYLAIIDITQ